MSVAICSSWSSTASFPLEREKKLQEVVLGSVLVPVPTRDDVAAAAVMKNDEEKEVERRPAGQFDLWTSIQAQQIKAKESKLGEPYVHPLTKHSSRSLMSQKSLEICTERLGSETGSDNYYDDMDYSMSSAHRPTKRVVVAQQQEQEELAVDEYIAAGVIKRKEHASASSVNYHCSSSIGSSRRRSPSRSFPPPLPSISCRDGPCVQMRPRRKDGRLVVQAVPVPSQNYLHAERQGGRLLLSFINNNVTLVPKRNANTEQTHEEVVDEDQESEEEEVEVVDRGTVVEVKVSTQPQKQSGGGGGGGAGKVHRSSIVINKFVSCSHVDKETVIVSSSSSSCSTSSTLRRTSTTSTTTAAAATVAASSIGAFPAADDGVSLQPCFSSDDDDDKKLVLFTTSKRRNREELLTDMKRCSQLRKPLFIWETSCIATSSS